MYKNFITADNGSFFQKEKPFRFIGCNMYELANVDSHTTELMIRDAFNEGFSVIRFWAFEPLNNNKLGEICGLAKDYNIRIIPVLADTHGYLQNYKIESSWYREGFKKNYLNHVKNLTQSFNNNEEILLWELINEPFTDSFGDIYNFSKTASEFIRSFDSNHLISIGTIGGIGDRFGNFLSRFNPDNLRELYSIKTLDAVSIHDYSFNSSVLERLDILFRLKGNSGSSKFFKGADHLINALPEAIDRATYKMNGKTYDFPLTLRNIWKYFNEKNISAAKSLKKPVYVGEVGFKKNLKDLRNLILKNELEKYFTDGISGVILWSFESQGRSRDGHDYGFDTEDGFAEVIKKIKSDILL